MENDNQPNFYKHFFDLIPEPILLIKKKSLEIVFANVDFQVHFKKSINFLRNKKIDIFLNDKSLLKSNLNLLNEKVGFFSIKEIPLFNDKYYDIKCVIPENEFDFMMLIFSETVTSKSSISNDYLIFDETFSILSHEINNPLSSIKMAAQLIEKTTADENLDLINIIKNETTRISTILNSLYFVDQKVNYMNKKKENIHELIRYCLLKIKKKKDKLQIIENFDPSLPSIEVDKNSMIQVFDNIFINSFESSNFSNFSYLKVTTEFLFGETIIIPNIKNSLKKNYILVTIEDNGSGIKKSDIEKIFIPFFSTKKRGSGVGLFLVKKIINYHNGEISVNSNNKITTIKLKLPL